MPVSDAHEEELVQEGVLPPDDFHDAIERVQEIADYDLEIPDDLDERLDAIAQSMLVDRSFLADAATALSVGHLILQGPPGTGKSMLARALIRAFHCSAMPVTAHEEWSAFEVVGRQELRVGGDGKETIEPVNGFFTEAVVQCAGSIVRHFDDPAQPQATWLLIDEMNRAHIDRAFGELFTVLGSDELVPILLPHQPPGNRELVTPRRFRIVATLNSIDKQFVNSLGQGLKRRFTFMTLDIPPQRPPGEAWGSDEADASLASREFSVVLTMAQERLKRRLKGRSAVEDDDVDARLDELFVAARPSVESLFGMVEGVRYANEGGEKPFVPIGTAQLIDAVELCASRAWMGDLTEAALGTALDWAASVKLAPQFDTDLRPDALRRFAEDLPAPFNQALRKELLQIVSAGLYYVG